MTDAHQDQEHEGVRQSAKGYHSYFLTDVPIRVIQSDFVPLKFDIYDRCIHYLKQDVLAKIMNNHSDPENNERNSQGKGPAEQVELLNTQVIQDLICDILEFPD